MKFHLYCEKETAILINQRKDANNTSTNVFNTLDLYDINHIELFEREIIDVLNKKLDWKDLYQNS